MILHGIWLNFCFLVIYSSLTSGYYFANQPTPNFPEEELIAPTPPSTDLFRKISISTPSYSWGFPPTTATDVKYTYPSYGFRSVQSHKDRILENNLFKHISQPQLISIERIVNNDDIPTNLDTSLEAKDIDSDRIKLVEHYKEQVLNDILVNKFGEISKPGMKKEVDDVKMKLSDPEEPHRKTDRYHVGSERRSNGNYHEVEESMLHVSPDFYIENNFESKKIFNIDSDKNEMVNEREIRKINLTNNNQIDPTKLTLTNKFNKAVKGSDNEENRHVTSASIDSENTNLMDCKESKFRRRVDKVAVAGGLRCYSCDNLTSATCQKITKYSNQTTCSDREDRCLVILTKNIFTDKITMRRSCGYKHTCQKLDSVATEVMKCHSCKTDLCNGSHSNLISLSVFLIMSIINVYCTCQ